MPSTRDTEASPPAPPSARRRGRPTLRSGVADLSREEIVTAALRQVRKHGLPALTVRRVAESLQVSTMALYQHVADKQGLVTAVVEEILNEIEPPSREGRSWSDWLLAQALETMRVFRAYPGVAAYVLDRGVFGVGQTSLRVADEILDVLIDAGFDESAALNLYVTSFCFVAGVVHTNLSPPKEIAAQDFPAISAVLGELEGGVDLQAVLEYGLCSLIAGVDVPGAPAGD